MTTYAPDDLLSPADLADVLGVAPATVHVYRHRGELPEPDRFVGRTPAWRYATIAEWSQARPSANGKGGRRARVVL